MNTKITQLNNYKRFLLNRVTSAGHLVEYIEDCLAREDEAINHSFHKVMVHNWADEHIQLFDTMAEYYGSPVIPIDITTQGDILTFYTSNLNLIVRIIKFDFMFPYNRNMFNVDILFNDKVSVEFFENAVTIEDIVTGVVSQRFKEKYELDLSDFCNDQEFADKKIFFYNLTLLKHFKILMLRMGKEAKSLNLSNNNLSQAPLDILNFFLRGELTAVNLSYNNIPSLVELQGVSRTVEKLWIEGNPLCDTLDAISYIKNVYQRFPRLTELDGIPLNQYGTTMPFFKNCLCRPDKKTKMLVEKFITLYFTHFDSPPKMRRSRLERFYDENALMTMQIDLPEQKYEHIMRHSRNIMDPTRRKHVEQNQRYYKTPAILMIYTNFLETVHDLTTFNVDVIMHDKSAMVLVVDGVFKENSKSFQTPLEQGGVFHFRRTFIFTIYTMQDLSVYHIVNEMFYVTPATEEQINSSFKGPIRNLNGMALMDPDTEDSEAVIKIFQHITQLKKSEAALRLKYHSWDVEVAIRDFLNDLKDDKVPADRFIEEDDFSDTSSLLDEID